jgi:hypothetical protein
MAVAASAVLDSASWITVQVTYCQKEPFVA